jgi:hypothetical protein
MSDEKNSEAILIRITPSIRAKVEGVAAATTLKPATLARMGLIEIVERLGARAPEISPETARIVAAAAQRGVDVQRVLADALEASLAAQAAQPPAA